MAQDDPGHLSEPVQPASPAAGAGPAGSEATEPAALAAAHADPAAPDAAPTDDASTDDAPTDDAPAGSTARRGLLLPLLAVGLAVVALALAFVPTACFVAGVPALAAIVLGFVGLVARDRRALAAVGLALGAVALVAAVTVSAVQITGTVTRFAADAGKVVSQLPGGGSTTSPGLSAGVHRITYSVTGDGRATISYSALVNGTSGIERESDVAVPHARTQRVTVERSGSSAQFVMVVIASDASKPAGCTIAIDGRVVATRSSGVSSGGGGFVTCTARTDS